VTPGPPGPGDVLSGNARPMSESLALGWVGSLDGKKTYRFVDPDVVSSCPDDLKIMVDGCCQPSLSSTVKQMEQKVLDPFSNDRCISDSFYLSKRVNSLGGGLVTSSAVHSDAVLEENGPSPIRHGAGSYAGGAQSGTVENLLKAKVVQEMAKYCGCVDPTMADMKSWPPSVSIRWKSLNVLKSPFELGILSWNTNGRLDLRGCRESLLKRWSMKGFVDVGLIQEHFKKAGSPIFDLF